MAQTPTPTVSLKWSRYIPDAHQPHPKQAVFLSLSCREALYGGAAGGGKSDALLMAALQYVDVPGYSALLLRRTYADLSLPQALMDRAREWLSPTDAHPVDGGKSWRFPSGATLTFGYMDSTGAETRYQGAELQFVGFDELTQFPEKQYRYLFSRLRRIQGVDVPLRMRAASNPGGIGHEWVRQRFIDGRSDGRVFVPARLDDNPSLDRAQYLESLSELDPVTKAQLLNGDGSARQPGGYFDRTWFRMVDPQDVPVNLRLVRFWDCAATEKREDNDPDATAGALVGICPKGTVYVLDMRRAWANPGGVKALVTRTALEDGRDVSIRMEQEPGSSGKAVIASYASELIGYDFRGIPSTGNKAARAAPVSAAASNGLVSVVRGSWNGQFFDELEAFDPTNPKLHDDQVDALSGAFGELTQRGATALFGWGK
jgi:predicted phage terminase large subunit-like protein